MARYGLTERELEIAGLAAQRKSSREIAEILNVSVKSVNNRLNAVYEKLGLGGTVYFDYTVAFFAERR